MQRLILTLILGCAVAAAQQAAAPAPTQTAAPAQTAQTPVATPSIGDEFVLGVDDVITVSVWREPDHSSTCTVRPDGKITLPLLGDLKAEGLTPSQLAEQIRVKLADIIKDPQVVVSVNQAHSLKITVAGEVLRPGSFPFTRKMTIIDAITAAGGVTEFAKRTKMYVLRRGADGSTQRLPVNYKEILKGKGENLQLEPRDTVVVP